MSFILTGLIMIDLIVFFHDTMHFISVYRTADVAIAALLVTAFVAFMQSD